MNKRMKLIIMKKNILFCFILIPLIGCPTPSNTSVSPSPSAQVTSRPTPSSQPTGGTGENFLSAQFYGKVFDENKNVLTFGTVKAEFIEIPEYIQDKPQFSNKEVYLLGEGRYAIYGFPVGSKVRITASSEGYKTMSRIETLKEDPLSNIFNFGGDGEDAKYALVKL
jgi:hypothetical protein